MKRHVVEANVGQPETEDSEHRQSQPQAVDALKSINPKVAVPMHCGDIVGTLNDRDALKAETEYPVVILDPKT